MKMKDSITFKIDEDFCIQVQLPSPLGDIYRYEYAEILLEHKNGKLFVYSDDFVFYGLDSFYYNLMSVINNEYNLHDSIKEDIGYMWNEYLNSSKTNRSKKFFMKKVENYETWVGAGCILWSSKGCETWLYNKDNKIFMHITPVYKWHFDEPKEGEEFVTYEKFMKSYKPYFIIEIKKTVAKRWFKKVKAIIKLIESNDPPMKKL